MLEGPEKEDATGLGAAKGAQQDSPVSRTSANSLALAASVAMGDDDEDDDDEESFREEMLELVKSMSGMDVKGIVQAEISRLLAELPAIIKNVIPGAPTFTAKRRSGLLGGVAAEKVARRMTGPRRPRPANSPRRLLLPRIALAALTAIAAGSGSECSASMMRQASLACIPHSSSHNAPKLSCVLAHSRRVAISSRARPMRSRSRLTRALSTSRFSLVRSYRSGLSICAPWDGAGVMDAG